MIRTNTLTRYELAAENNGRRVRIAYTVRRGRSTLLSCCRDHGQKLLDFAGLGEHDGLTFGQRAGDGAMIGTCRVWYTGRTEREAVNAGIELDHIAA